MDRRWCGAKVVAGALGALALLAVVLGGGDRAEAIGLLVPTAAEVPPLAIRSHRVTVDVTDAAAVTRVEQVFINHTDRQLEATFYFPVPPGSTVSDFSLWINGVKTQGAVLDRAKARATYEQIVRRTQDPGLIEYIDGTLFQARIFPVPARGEQKVEIAFATVLEQVDGLRQLRYPLKTGRRTAALLDDFTITVNASSRAPLKAIYSPTHKIEVIRKSDHDAVIGFEDAGVDLEQDFLLYLGTGDDEVGVSMLTYDPDGAGGEDGYYLLVIAPRLAQTERAIDRKAVTFVVDTSGSMTGEKIQQAREALKGSIQKLRPGDLFNVVRFSTDVQLLFGAPSPATPDSLNRGLGFANALEAAGGTAIDEALQTALRWSPPPGVPHFVIFLTDGRPTVGEIQIPEIQKRVQRSIGAARLFTFGIGYDVNAVLLDQIAESARGYSDYIGPQEDIQARVVALNNKIAYPALTNVRVDYGSPNVYDVYPRTNPDLFRGGQVVVLGRYKNAMPSRINLSGQVDGGTIVVEYDETERFKGAGARSAAHDFIPKLWATRKVGYLLSEIRTNGEQAELRDEVIALGKKYGLVTPYTSYLAVDDAEFDQNAPVVRGQPRPDRQIQYNFQDDEVRGELLRPSSRAQVMKKHAESEKVLKARDNLGSAHGKNAVDTSVETNRMKQASSNEDTRSMNTRWAGGKLFVLEGNVWVEQGKDRKKAKRIAVGSDEYFKLLEKKPAVGKKLSVDRNVAFEDDGVMYETY